jgi:hypothetical protein
MPITPRNAGQTPLESTAELEALRFERSYHEEVATALSALDCLLLGRKGVYASSELTSGRRAQRLQHDHGVADSRTLRDGLGPQRYNALLWAPNVDAAVAFADELRASLGGVELVISPAPFTAPAWSQQAYLAFWEKVIRTRVKCVYFNNDWEYSNGCVYEFAVATDAGLPTMNRDGQVLPVKVGVERIVRAIRELEAEGLETQAIGSTLDQIKRRLAR